MRKTLPGSKPLPSLTAWTGALTSLMSKRLSKRPVKHSNPIQALKDSLRAIHLIVYSDGGLVCVVLQDFVDVVSAKGRKVVVPSIMHGPITGRYHHCRLQATLLTRRIFVGHHDILSSDLPISIKDKCIRSLQVATLCSRPDEEDATWLRVTSLLDNLDWCLDV